jgi:hypothetical protein
MPVRARKDTTMASKDNKCETGPKWYASGRGIFCRDAGFQLATMPLTVNWQEDTTRIVELLNKGAMYDDLSAESAADKTLINKLTDICPDCPPDVNEVGCETCDGSGVVPKSPSKTRE